MNKLIRMSEALAKAVQQYANNNHNGNFNEAVREILTKKLSEEA